MNSGQASTIAPVASSAFDHYRFPGALVDDPGTSHISYDGLDSGDYVLPAPDPGRRVSLPLEPADRRRLDLHAALTTAGIAPLPGDLAAIEALCTLDDTTHAALQRWITRCL
ncbi:hypothetical protein [Streptomyces sp. PKU-EA00015]|uniref:hypothetical protein n=1 Tax=Streptomyces sp. PKU-EA00015 TaxID=2748326 RepID=UPI00210DB99C|nr:hypothetical protein [Streptomyces sp. PKU-EA00015]